MLLKMHSHTNKISYIGIGIGNNQTLYPTKTKSCFYTVLLQYIVHEHIKENYEKILNIIYKFVRKYITTHNNL